LFVCQSHHLLPGLLPPAREHNLIALGRSAGGTEA
jgi:hypothetical protein